MERHSELALKIVTVLLIVVLLILTSIAYQ